MQVRGHFGLRQFHLWGGIRGLQISAKAARALTGSKDSASPVRRY